LLVALALISRTEHRLHACPVLSDCSLPDAGTIMFDAIGVDHIDVLLLGQIHDPEALFPVLSRRKSSPLMLAANTDRLGTS